MVEERAQQDEHDALRPLHEAHLALADERLSARPRVADHERGDHDEGHQDHVAETVDAAVIDQQPEEEHHVGVAVDDRVEVRAEDCDLVDAAGDAAVDHIEDAGAEDHQAGVEKHGVAVEGVGMSEKERRNDVDDEPDEGENVG